MAKQGSGGSGKGWPDWLNRDASRSSWRGRRLSCDEQLLAEVLQMLMALEDTTRVVGETVALLETLPWEQIRLLRDKLAGEGQ